MRAVAVAGPGDPATAWLAQRQYGVISVDQLMVCGLGRGAIRHRHATGRLHRVHRGVYLVGHRVAPVGAREVAAVLASGPAALLSHRSSGAWWEMAERVEGPVDVTVIGRNAGYRPGVRAHRVGGLRQGEARVRRGIPVTSPVRTLLDLAAVLEERALERCLDRAIASRLVRATELEGALRKGGRGHARLRSLLADVPGTTRTRSDLEERFLALVRRAELPAPELNVAVAGYEVDALWREQRLVVELDGYQYHGGRGSFERDRIRDADVDDAGLRLRRFTWRRITRHPEAVVASLARALASG